MHKTGKNYFVVMLALSAFLAGLVSGFEVAAGQDNQAYLHWFKANNAHLRTAISYLRTQNGDFAALELEDLIASKPSHEMGENQVRIVALMTSVASKALEQIDGGDLRAARKTLLGLRRKVFQAHQKAGIVVFADCIWQLRSTGLQMWYYRKRDNGPDLSDPKQAQAVTAAVSAYLDQLKVCNGLADKETTSSPDYVRLFDGARQTLEKVLGESIPENKGRQLYRRLNEIRSFDRLMFLRFG